MSVIMKKFQVRAGGKTFFPGDVIPKLDKKTEEKLVNDGFCDYVDQPDKSENQPDDGPNTSHPLEP